MDSTRTMICIQRKLFINVASRLKQQSSFASRTLHASAVSLSTDSDHGSGTSSSSSGTDPSGIFIAACLVNPGGGNAMERKNEWVTVANFSPNELDLAGWTLSDTSGKRNPLTLNAKLLPGETYRINPLKNEDGQVILHNKGGTLELIDPDGNVVNEEPYIGAPQGEVTIFEAPTRNLP